MKVYAKDAEIQKHIKHPTGKKGFKDDGSADWPDDQFTKRRIKDGDVTTDPPEPPPEGGETGMASRGTAEPSPEPGAAGS